MAELNKDTSLYKIIVASKYRIWRHMLLILVLALISFNQTIYLFSKNLGTIGNYIYLICFVSLVLYLMVAYFNLYILVPKLLLKKKYIQYTILLFSSVGVIILMRSVGEYRIQTELGLGISLQTYMSPFVLLNNLSYCIITSICIFGIALSVLFKHFMTQSQHVTLLEKEQVQSEVIRLKEQISPDFLYKILNYTSLLVKTDANKVSTILMKLSQMLRYQLYDCNRDKVLLNSAIKFIDNYLTIIQLYNNKIDYKISTTGSINQFLISPLLLFTFVKYIVSLVTELNKQVEIDLIFEVDGVSNKKMFFTCTLSNKEISLNNHDLLFIKQSLNHLYQNDYSLVIDKTMIQLELNSVKL